VAVEQLSSRSPHCGSVDWRSVLEAQAVAAARVEPLSTMGTRVVGHIVLSPLVLDLGIPPLVFDL
jgi:hypothetical protein